MSIVSKFLPAIALAATLSPLAAVASSMPPVSAQAYMAPMHQQDPIAPSSATIDRPTRIYSNDVFPDSFGG